MTKVQLTDNQVFGITLALRKVCIEDRGLTVERLACAPWLRCYAVIEGTDQIAVVTLTIEGGLTVEDTSDGAAAGRVSELLCEIEALYQEFEEDADPIKGVGGQ